jgi:hypothetical protein
MNSILLGILRISGCDIKISCRSPAPNAKPSEAATVSTLDELCTGAPDSEEEDLGVMYL